MPPSRSFSRSARRALAFAGRPVRRAWSRGNAILHPYRGYGSRERAFVIGRVFRQRSMTPVQGYWDICRQARDVIRRLIRRPLAGVPVHGELLGAATVAETDAEGYFRLEWHLDPGTVQGGQVWHHAALRMEDAAEAQAFAEVYIPPPQARFAVISDIDDTVMYTGVANKAGMMFRLFFQSAASRTAFPGVAALYRALHGGASGSEGNPMLYVSRAPWGIYDVLETFFRNHSIPGGPILFLREWGVSWRNPVPRRAEEHKRVLIEAIMDLYRDLPFVLIGDSGQHDPEVYRQAVERDGKRVLAVYIRDVTPRNAVIRREIEAISRAVAAAGSELLLSESTVEMAQHAARLGLIAPEAVAAVREDRRAEDAPDDAREA